MSEPAIGLRATEAGRRPRGIGALAATMWLRSTGEGGAAYAMASWKLATLPVGRGSAALAAASAWRALMAATCAGVACFGVAGLSPQMPRALIMSTGFGDPASAAAASGLDSGLASELPSGAGLAAGFIGLGAATSWASAEASWNAAVARARGAAPEGLSSEGFASEGLASEGL